MSNHLLNSVIDKIRKWQIKSGHDIEWIDDPACIAARRELAKEILALVAFSFEMYIRQREADQGDLEHDEEV